MAPYLAGKLAIGKIDCTSSSGKPLCESHKVRGYPTLKIYRDGDFFDYTGKRDADSMISFAEKMSMPAVRLVESKIEFDQTLLSTMDGSSSKDGSEVAFLIYDPKAKKNKKDNDVDGNTQELVEQYLSSTTATQIFGQVARKFQHKARFGMLHPEKREELEKFGLSAKSKGPWIAKIEMDVEPLVYSGKMNTLDLMDFVRDNNAALVTHLERYNFRTLAGMGRPLFVGISFGSNTQSLVSQLRDYAKTGKDKDKYRFATMDGTQWEQFLKQFSIVPPSDNSAPQYLVLDTSKRLYYQNETFTDLHEFLQGIENGTIPMREQSPLSSTNDGPMQKFHNFFIKHMPFMILLLFVVLAAILCFVLNDNEDEIRYRTQLEAQSERTKKVQQQRKQKPIKED
jgi:hypothetical protein